MNSPLPEWCEALCPPLDQVRTLLQLGNKRTNNKPWQPYFLQRGIACRSIDLNGMDDAEPLDLTDDLDLGTFDLVTNFGTSEHVLDQVACWRNIHNACGKWLVSSTPIPGYWQTHGRYYPHPEFFYAFADLNGYEIEDIHHGQRMLLNVRMRKAADVGAYVHPASTTMFFNATGTKTGVAYQ